MKSSGHQMNGAFWFRLNFFSPQLFFCSQILFLSASGWSSSCYVPYPHNRYHDQLRRPSQKRLCLACWNCYSDQSKVITSVRRWSIKKKKKSGGIIHLAQHMVILGTTRKQKTRWCQAVNVVNVGGGVLCVKGRGGVVPVALSLCSLSTTRKGRPTGRKSPGHCPRGPEGEVVQWITPRHFFGFLINME